MGSFGMGHGQEPRPLMPKRPDSPHLRRSGQRASKLIPIILGTKLRLRYEKKRESGEKIGIRINSVYTLSCHREECPGVADRSTLCSAVVDG